MSRCASGCVIVGEHLADCAGVDDEGRSCRGCLPCPSEFGVLCPRCWGRLQSAVRTLPALIDRLFEVAVPSMSSPQGCGGGGRPSPGSRSLCPASLGTADDLVAMLASWCDQVADALGVSAPSRRGLWVTEERVLRDPATGGVYVSGSEVAGIRDPAVAGRLVAWLEPRLPSVTAFPWAADMLSDLGDATARAAARWPVEEPDRRVTDVRCPSCGAFSLVVHPPRVEGGSEQVVCSLPACGLVMPEEDWAQARAWAVVVARMSVPAEAVAS